MNKLTPIFGLTTFTFSVKGFASFQIAAENVVNAFEAANCKIREDGMVEPGATFAWFDGVHSNSFYLGNDVFLD